MNSLQTTILAPITAFLAAFCLAAAAASFVLVTYEANKFLDAQLQEIAINTRKKLQWTLKQRMKTGSWSASGIARGPLFTAADLQSTYLGSTNPVWPMLS
jgi:hypothetical protein